MDTNTEQGAENTSQEATLQGTPQDIPKKSLLDDVKISSEADFSEHLKDLKQPKQVYDEAIKAGEKQPEKPPSPAPENPTGTGTENTGENKEGTKGEQGPKMDSQTLRMKKAYMVAKTADVAIWGSAYLFAKMEPEQIKATEKEIKLLAEGWADLMEETGDFKIPGWVQLVICMGTIYGVKIFMIIRLKRAEEEIRQQQEAEKRRQQTNDPTSAHEAYKQSQRQTTQNQEPQASKFKVLTHKCNLPGCDIQIPTSRKFCSTSHRTKWTNHIKYKRPIVL